MHVVATKINWHASGQRYILLPSTAQQNTYYITPTSTASFVRLPSSVLHILSRSYIILSPLPSGKFLWISILEPTPWTLPNHFSLSLWMPPQPHNPKKQNFQYIPCPLPKSSEISLNTSDWPGSLCTQLHQYTLWSPPYTAYMYQCDA